MHPTGIPCIRVRETSMIRDALTRMFGRRFAAPGESIPYEEARLLVQSGKTAERRRVADDPEARPELLYFLARDISPMVRRAVALNPRTPRKADMLLALDDVPEIRTLIAEKVTAQIAGVAHSETTQIWQLTVAVLEALARDDMPSVRQLVAETARGMEKLPAVIATTLGRDREADVAVPALGYPGRIADEDLVEIVVQAPSQRVVGAVARRPAIGPNVTDAVVEHGDDNSIATLLGNPSAEIRPATLDRVIDRAPPVDAWHEALVNRPQLSANAAIRLAGFVAGRLSQVLQSRTDVDMSAAAAGDPAPPAETEDPVARARRYHAQGTLGEDLVLDAIGADQDFVIAALSLRARLPPAVVNKILVSQSAKGLTALSWRAGFSMRLATQLQLRVARLTVKSRLVAGSGGTYPLTPAEMEWQIEFFRTLVPAGA